MSSVESYFISYRRNADGSDAEEIAKELQSQVGKDCPVFFDQHPQDLPAGCEWPMELVSRVLKAETVVVVIGPAWLDELDKRNREPDGSWIEDRKSDDWVRREVMYALHFGKRVIPLFINGARSLKKDLLPPDLISLPKKQAIKVAESPVWKDEVKELIEYSRQNQQSLAVPIPYRGVNRPAAENPPGIDDICSAFGQRWFPDREEDSPHRWDYKFSILDPEIRHQIRIALLASHATGELDHAIFNLARLEASGEPRKFAHSAGKTGMFIQASCLITDGEDTGVTEQVLLSIREDYQIHDTDDRRNVQGESCLIASCLTAFDTHNRTGHLSKAILNDLKSLNPWAVFSRKLLFPDSLIDCRFLGIGFNLKNPDKEYLHLVWHVRTRTRPEMILVPEREKVLYDKTVWQTIGEVVEFDFEKAPIDRLVVEDVFGLDLPTPEKGPPSVFCGFAKVPMFEQTNLNQFQPVKWRRDTVPLDVLRMFQQKIHRRSREIVNSSTDGIKDAFQEFFDELSGKQNVPVILRPCEIEDSLEVTLVDESGNPTGRYLLLVYCSSKPKLTDDVVSDIREQSFQGFPDGTEPEAVIVLHGVHSPRWAELQGVASLHQSGETPIHVIRVALSREGTPLKRVSHAVIPIQSNNASVSSGFLVTHHKTDET
ncbi:MAG: toll/interleukin-1 receptor domain-containing protein, partial [Verrucomicrobiota bacterium]